jgi:hypothetical protein
VEGESVEAPGGGNVSPVTVSPVSDIAKPTVRDVLAAAVASVGGSERAGQVKMAEAVAGALSRGEHLLVQAGTGTGKSLGYLAPSLLHTKRVVVATATLNLQHQLVERDIPALLGRRRGGPRESAEGGGAQGPVQLPACPAPAYATAPPDRPGTLHRRYRSGRSVRRCWPLR